MTFLHPDDEVLYMAAHAPAEPQAWFKPQMVEKRPDDLWVSDGDKYTYPHRAAAVRECGDNCHNKNKDEQEAWDAEETKQTFIQWPLAWAQEVVKHIRANLQGYRDE